MLFLISNLLYELMVWWNDVVVNDTNSLYDEMMWLWIIWTHSVHVLWTPHPAWILDDSKFRSQNIKCPLNIILGWLMCCCKSHYSCLPRVWLGGHTMGGPTLSLLDIHKWCKVPSNSVTYEATHFVGPQKILYASVHTQSSFIRTQPTRALNGTGSGYHLACSNFWSRPLILLPIQYSPLFPNCPARSHIKPFYQLFNFLTFHSRTKV
jgi:hypothetical protein